uniref:DUF4283 domain-containing protein n=1 Tax=Oryza brachyantha TaxID=4533 RepID=J3MP14_ORYBR
MFIGFRRSFFVLWRHTHVQAESDTGETGLSGIAESMVEKPFLFRSQKQGAEGVGEHCCGDTAVVTWAIRAPPSTGPSEIEKVILEEFKLRRGEVAVSLHHPEAFLIKFQHRRHCEEAVKKGFAKRCGIEVHFIKWRSLQNALGAALMFKVRLCLDGVPMHAWAADVAERLTGCSCTLEQIETDLVHPVEAGNTRTINLWVWNAGFSSLYPICATPYRFEPSSKFSSPKCDHRDDGRDGGHEDAATYKGRRGRGGQRAEGDAPTGKEASSCCQELTVLEKSQDPVQTGNEVWSPKAIIPAKRVFERILQDLALVHGDLELMTTVLDGVVVPMLQDTGAGDIGHMDHTAVDDDEEAASNAELPPLDTVVVDMTTVIDQATRDVDTLPPKPNDSTPPKLIMQVNELFVPPPKLIISTPPATAGAVVGRRAKPRLLPSSTNTRRSARLARQPALTAMERCQRVLLRRMGLMQKEDDAAAVQEVLAQYVAMFDGPCRRTLSQHSRRSSASTTTTTTTPQTPSFESWVKGSQMRSRRWRRLLPDTHRGRKWEIDNYMYRHTLQLSFSFCGWIFGGLRAAKPALKNYCTMLLIFITSCFADVGLGTQQRLICFLLESLRPF